MPERLSNGREVGAWCYGLACGVFQPVQDKEPVLVVELPKDKLEGAAAVIVAAGGVCAEVSPLHFEVGTGPCAEGNTLLRVALGL